MSSFHPQSIGRWLLGHIAGGLVRFIVGALLGGFCLFIGFAPAEWFAAVFSDPPFWLAHPLVRLAVVIAGTLAIIGLVLWDRWAKRKMTLAHSNVTATTQAAPAIRVPPAENPRTIRQTIPDPAKRVAIDNIYAALRNAEAIYDQGCELANSWRERIRNAGPAAYAEELARYRKAVSDAIVRVADLCDEHDQFNEIHAFRNSSFSFQTEVFQVLNMFIQKVKDLPPVNEPLLDLLSAEAEALKKSVAVFGSWARQSKVDFRHMRSLC